MYNLKTLTDPTLTQSHQILSLYKAENWWPGNPEPEMVARVIAGSHLFLTAVENDTIIAMGRAISDRVSDAYIQDVAVAKTHRHQGIGAALIRELVRLLKKDGIEWIGLIAEKGSNPFYETVGFGQMPQAVPMLHNDTLSMMGLS